MASFLKKEKKHHSPSPGQIGHTTGGASTVLPHHKKNETFAAPEHHHKKNGTSPEPHHHKKNATSMGAAVVGPPLTCTSDARSICAPSCLPLWCSWRAMHDNARTAPVEQADGRYHHD